MDIFRNRDKVHYFWKYLYFLKETTEIILLSIYGIKFHINIYQKKIPLYLYEKSEMSEKLFKIYFIFRNNK